MVKQYVPFVDSFPKYSKMQMGYFVIQIIIKVIYRYRLVFTKRFFNYKAKTHFHKNNVIDLHH